MKIVDAQQCQIAQLVAQPLHSLMSEKNGVWVPARSLPKMWIIPNSSHKHDLPYSKGKKIGDQGWPYLQVKITIAPLEYSLPHCEATAIDWESIFIIVVHDFVIDDGGLEMYVVGSP